ncbi:MAG: deoxynucleoside kinase [Clostridiales bacterium]|nr:deoxynucleoside kinase [Clostridiales bacterium]
MKIYITGSVGSGKTTLARKISQKTGVSCFHLDEIVYEECPEDSWGNKKRPPEERDALFAAALAQPHFIMEDAGRKCFLSAPEQADRVILLDISPFFADTGSFPAGCGKSWAWKNASIVRILPCSKVCCGGRKIMKPARMAQKRWPSPFPIS